ncbi:M56 family metallopeptidase [Halonotius pteroides]|uniref:M56 family metallopeptidase n=1 Tax=Halonotius pteroides TaxID=268735 RepID=UPI0010591614|nr:M56 family metallopeptidase [Halonotius pteroides]
MEKDLDEVDIEPVVEQEENEGGFTVSKSWSFSRFLGLCERRVSLDYEEGRVYTGTYVDPVFFALSACLIVSYCLYVALLPDLTRSIFYEDYGYLLLLSVTAVVGLLTLFTVSHENLVDIQDYGVIVSWFSNPYPGLAVLGILAAVFSRFAFLFPPVVTGVVVTMILTGSVFKILVDVYIPREKTGFSKLLIIPFQAAFYRLIPFGLLVFIALGPLSLLSGFDVSLSFYSEIEDDIPLFGLASMFSDFTGSFAGSEAMATLYNGIPSLVNNFILFMILLISFEYLSCYRTHRYLRNSRIQGTDSSVISSLSAVAFFFSNLMVLLLGGLAAAILVYDFAGVVLVPSESAVLLSSGFYSNILVMSENYIGGSLIVIEQSMAGLPFLSTRAYTTLYYLVFFTPLILTTALWVRHIVSLYQERRIYTELDSLDTDLASINVVTVDSKAPVVGPVSTGFGSTSILVSQAVVEKLDDDELKAVLRHEEYHIINRDLLANIVASILSVGFGGRNTLLAFYGYPGIEKSADKYAVDKTDKQTVLKANRKMYKLYHDFKTQDAELHGFERLWKPFYEFYFGEFLLGTSHNIYKERIEMISDFEE